MDKTLTERKRLNVYESWFHLHQLLSISIADKEHHLCHTNLIFLLLVLTALDGMI